MNPELLKKINQLSREFSFDEDFLTAIVLVESNGDINAMRYEPGYPYLYNSYTSSPLRFGGTQPPANFRGPGYISKETELIGQRTSWGPMQVMGAVAREYGFKKFFPELCSIGLGMDIGCKHLYNLRNRFRLKTHELEALATAFNTGSPKVNHPYWEKVQNEIRRNTRVTQ